MPTPNRPPQGSPLRALRAVPRNALRRLVLLPDRVRYLLGGIDSIAARMPYVRGRRVLRMLRQFGARVGEGTRFKRGLRVDNASGDADSTGDFSNLEIGTRCFIGLGVLFDLPDRITIGDEVAISAGVTILTHADCGARAMSSWYPRRRAPVRIGLGSWIGANATILAGVTLGDCCVVGAGAVVTRSFPAYSVVVGVPARLVRVLERAGLTQAVGPSAHSNVRREFLAESVQHDS
jgi:acetyltransferase-like isoleucine patch superfamily enzyme